MTVAPKSAASRTRPADPEQSIKTAESPPRSRGYRLHGPAHHRRDPRPARPDQDRGLPARRHRRRHAARAAVEREFPPPQETPHDRHRGPPRTRRPVPSALSHDRMTRVELTWIEKQIEYWIRFGQEPHEQIIDRRQRILSFPPNSVFAFVRWASNEHGTVISRIDIVRAVEPRRAVYQTVPFVTPGRRNPAADRWLAEGRGVLQLHRRRSRRSASIRSTSRRTTGGTSTTG